MERHLSSVLPRKRHLSLVVPGPSRPALLGLECPPLCGGEHYLLRVEDDGSEWIAARLQAPRIDRRAMALMVSVEVVANSSIQEKTRTIGHKHQGCREWTYPRPRGKGWVLATTGITAVDLEGRVWTSAEWTRVRTREHA